MDTIRDIDTVDIDLSEPAVVAIDQRLLPNEVRLLRLRTEEEIYDAIKALAVRGAPAIGVCAALGIYVVAERISRESASDEEFIKEYIAASDYIDSSRPTAVNLSWALRRMKKCLLTQYETEEVERESVLLTLQREAVAIRDEDIEMCKKIGEYGAELISDGDGILTHCNAGRLATVRYGTATSPMYRAFGQGKNIKEYCD